MPQPLVVNDCPHRSTIFCGDSLDLNGLMFRQMSGRAGRRGFDLLGQVAVAAQHDLAQRN
eukprot:3335964-Amphidinium_carterae.1